ncbi:hypothetical protein CES85_5684 [Ochrobactrum quorumnocens]|uniref:Uncharacterized protein n=1 Tax=Ochrobactrum quorumnocens TaxID=271865 RepID=A0A248UEB7_9HYPH|nr:hypothetical protein CES85_5684 [[Ochrobactrum] quorumnocens]
MNYQQLSPRQVQCVLEYGASVGDIDRSVDGSRRIGSEEGEYRLFSVRQKGEHRLSRFNAEFCQSGPHSPRQIQCVAITPLRA